MGMMGHGGKMGRGMGHGDVTWAMNGISMTGDGQHDMSPLLTLNRGQSCVLAIRYVDGRVAIDWGVYDAPETFVVDRRGWIASRWVGPIMPEILETVILPLVASMMPSADAADEQRNGDREPHQRAGDH